MAKAEKSEALILRRFPHSESSLIVHAFTRTHGRIPFMAKGARRGGKRGSVPLVPVVLLEFVWTPSQRSEIQLLREVSLVDGYGNIHTNFEKMAWAQAAIESLGRCLKGEGEYDELFSQTDAYLKALMGELQRPENLFRRFRLQILQHLGFEIELVVPENASLLFFDPLLGELTTTRTNDRGIPIHLGALKLLKQMQRGSFDEVKRLRISSEASREIDWFLDAAFRHAFDHWGKLESLKLLENVDKFNSETPE
ncbi:DNA repair protein RecO [bacterium]|nr:DNA repair protein RecO [bacterium]